MNTHSKSLNDPKMGKWENKYYNFIFWWSDNVYSKFPDCIRWFIRDCKNWYYKQISTRIWPRNKFISNAIGREYKDLVQLIPDVLYQCIISFVEKEECFETINWESSRLKDVEKDIREIYNWAKTGRAEFLEKIQNSYPPIGDLKDWLNKSVSSEDYNREYGEVNRLEEEFDKLDTKYLNLIIARRSYLWT